MELKVKFCWLCGNKLWGKHAEFLVIDGFTKTLHKNCAKQVKTELDFRKLKDGSYKAKIWDSGY